MVHYYPLALGNQDYPGGVVWCREVNDANDLTSGGNGGGQRVDSCTTPTNLTGLGMLAWADNHGGQQCPPPANRST